MQWHALHIYIRYMVTCTSWNYTASEAGNSMFPSFINLNMNPSEASLIHVPLYLQSYIEPETGHRFLSLRAVERHLKEAKEYTPTLKAFKHSHKHNVYSITSYNKWNSVYLVLWSLTTTVFLCFQVSSRSNSQNDCVPDEIQSIFVDDEHPAKSKENTTMPKEVTPGNDSGVSLWSR